MSTQSWVHQIKGLPVLPQVAMRVTERMQSPQSTVQEISELIRSDMGLSTKVLKLANSSYYSIPGGVADVSKALQYLGFTTISQIVLTSSVFGSFKSQGTHDFPLSQFWMHSFGVGQLAEITARSLQHTSPSDAFIGGLMHDVGKLILLELAPDQLNKIVHYAQENKISFIDAEKALGLTTHVELGVQLAQHWNLPKPIIDSIAHHHSGASGNLIEWANLWANANHIGNSGSFDSDFIGKLNRATEQLKLSNKNLQTIEAQFQKEFEKAGAILGGH